MSSSLPEPPSTTRWSAGRASAIAHLLDDAERRTAMAQANERYVTLHHDRETELTRLLRIVAGAATADRLLAAGTVRG